MIVGVARAGRHQVTADVSDAISGTGGWIINHALFSNISIAIQFSLPSQGLGEFQDRVAAAGVRLDADSMDKMQAAARKYAAKPMDITASLNITFKHDEPDLRREIPAVPG